MDNQTLKGVFSGKSLSSQLRGVYTRTRAKVVGGSRERKASLLQTPPHNLVVLILLNVKNWCTNTIK